MKVTFIPSHAPRFFKVRVDKDADLDLLRTTVGVHDFLCIEVGSGMRCLEAKREFPDAVVSQGKEELGTSPTRTSIELDSSKESIVKKYVEFKEGDEELVKVGCDLLQKATERQ